MATELEVAGMQCPLAATMDEPGDGFGVVPPQLARDASEKGESFDQSVENGLGPLRGNRDGEGAVGITPGGDQHGHLSAAIGEVNVDVTEVGFDAIAGRVFERDEGLAVFETASLDVASNLVVAAYVFVFTNESSVDPGGGMPLLGWCGLILRKDIVNDLPNRSENR
jgi:hypothetical protein